MSKKPSAETQLREARIELKRARYLEVEALGALNDVRSALVLARGQATKAQQEAAEWRKRFDDLLARVPLKPLDGDAK